MSVSAEELVEAAKSAVKAVSVEDARRLIDQAGWLFVDVRETEERARSAIAGSVHAPRGNLEFLIDSSHASFLPALAGPRRLIFVCGSGARSALSAKLAQAFGYDCRYLTGGMRAWEQHDNGQ